MDSKTIQLFVQALVEADSASGSSLVVSVKYRGDDSVYEEWAPNRSEIIGEDGLQDPGFGSGPVTYSEIERLSVPAVSPRLSTAIEYSKKFDVLVSLTSGMPCVQITANAVTLNIRQGGD